MKITKRIMLLVLCLGLAVVMVLPGCMYGDNGEPNTTNTESTDTNDSITTNTSDESTKNTDDTNSDDKSAENKETGQETQNVEKLQTDIKDLQAKTEELKQEITSLKTEISEIQADDGNSLNYISIVLAAISLLLSAFIGYGLRSKKISKPIEKQFQELRRMQRTLEKQIEELDRANEMKFAAFNSDFFSALPKEKASDNETKAEDEKSTSNIELEPKRNKKHGQKNMNTHDEIIIQQDEPVLPPQKQYLDSQGRNVMVAFKRMMDQIAGVSTYEGEDIRENFAEKYQVRVFRCVNAEARMTNRELLPKFEESMDGELWGISLQDGTLAVFPNLSTYESTIHFQGGMKELFVSNYNGGSYSQIQVKSPAIVTGDYQTKNFDSDAIQQKGELILSEQ